jgi:DNA polymerase III alpha subunit
MAAKGHADFVHLRVRSVFSLLEGAMQSKEIARLARDMRMPAVAVADTNNLFGAYEISERARWNSRNFFPALSSKRSPATCRTPRMDALPATPRVSSA